MAGMRHILRQTRRQAGFTLLEIIVVLGILVIVSGSVLTTFGPNFIEGKEQTATLYEMTQIRDAILKFKRDNPNFQLSTNLCTPADASFLFDDEYDNDGDCERGEESGAPDPDEFNTWDVNYRLGWQGPYITKVRNELADIDTDILFNGDETTPATEGTPEEGVSVLTDAHNNPYYFFDLNDNALARIVSTGTDGVYDSYNHAVSPGDECDPENDDIILCLR